MFRINRFDITYDEQINATKIDKDLIERTNVLDDNISDIDSDLNQVKNIIGGSIATIVSGSSDTITISDTMDSLRKELDRVKLEKSIMHLRLAEEIDAAEYKRLMSLINSPDEENHTIAISVIEELTNKT